MRIFGDYISDKVFHKREKYFTSAEINIINKFAESIYKNFKSAKLISTSQSKSYDQPDFLTETINKYFNINKKKFYLRFNKFYSDNQKNWEPDTGKSGYVDRISIGTWHIPKDDIYRNFHHQNKEFYSLYSIPTKQDFEEFKKNNRIIIGINCSVAEAGFSTTVRLTNDKKDENELMKKVLPKVLKAIKKIK